MNKKVRTRQATDTDLQTKMSHLEGRFNFFVTQAMAVITIVDKNSTIIYQSPSVKDILGYDHQKRIGKNFLYSRLVHPDDVIVKEQLFKKAQQNPGINYKGELRMLHKNGTWRWMEVVFNNQLHNQAIAGIMVVTHDITELKVLELQKNEFMSITSHELRTPLTTIRAFSQLLLEKVKSEIQRKQEFSFIEKIIIQTDRIARLIDELLDVSKIQEGRLTIQPHPLQLHVIIKRIIDDFHYISDHEILFSANTRSFVLCDENRIGQVMINLLNNAIKYSPAVKKIEVTMTRKGRHLITSVKDHGEGIPTEKQQYIFQRFFRINNSSSTETSLGLGLYIASEIVRLHEGKIWLESRKGKGSTFYFSLPIYAKNRKK